MIPQTAKSLTYKKMSSETLTSMIPLGVSKGRKQGEKKKVKAFSNAQKPK